MQDTLIKSFLEQADRCPEKLCVAFKDERLSYGELRHKVLSCACSLYVDYGIKPGDFVMISAVSKPEFIVAFLAAQYLGAVTVPVDKLVKPESLMALVKYVKPVLLLSDCKVVVETTRCVSLKDFVSLGDTPAAGVSPFEPDLESVAEVIFTTGTTGVPKGAMLAYRSIKGITKNTLYGTGMRSEDVVLIPLPLNHSVGLRVMRTALSIGATIVLQNGFTFAKELEQNINGFGCTALISVPASIEVVRRQMGDRFGEVLGKLRYIEFGAGSLSVPMKKALASELPQTNLYNTWGSSETGGVIFLDIHANSDKLESLGLPRDGVEFAVQREDGSFDTKAWSLETAGRMALKGDMRMLGYYNMPDESAATVQGEWLVTNDLAYQDSDGFIYMLGRADDIINVGGEKVAPVEIENVALEYSGLKECAAIGVEDSLLGQVPVLYYVMEAGRTFDREKFVEFMHLKVERYKIPQKYVELNELPRNRMLKLDRKALKKRWAENGEMSFPNETIRTILTRSSIRDFTDTPIARTTLEQIIRCALQAPSAHNMQTWRFTVIQSLAVIDRLKDVLTRKEKKYKTVCYGFNNPVVVVLVTNDERNANAAQDSACAAENMMLAAHSLGLGSVWNNAIRYMQDDAELRDLLCELKVPLRHKPWLLLLLGYPSGNEAKSPQRRTDVVEWI